MVGKQLLWDFIPWFMARQEIIYWRQKVILADGKQVLLKQYSKEEFSAKAQQEDLEGKIYKYIESIYSNEDLKKEIIENFPEKEVSRRNNGYALDSLIENPNPNLAKFFAGSEGTLGFATEFKLNLLSLPPKHKAVICVPFFGVER